MDARTKRKKQFFLFLPVLAVPLMTLMFWSLGGGQPREPAAIIRSGLNTTLPSAQLTADPLDKLSLYQQAEKDSLNALSRHNRNLALEGLLDQRLPSHRQDGEDDQAPGGNITGHYRNNKSTNSAPEEKVEEKLRQLQQSLDASVDTGTQKRATVSVPASDPAQEEELARLEKMMASLGGHPQRAGSDPEMDQLSDMLQKILEVQHPELVRDRLQKLSEKNARSVYPISSGEEGKVSELLAPAWATDTSLALKDSLRQLPPLTARGNRFYELEEGDTEVSMQSGIPAVIHETQTLVAGATVKLRLQQDIYLHGRQVPAGTFVFGKCSLSGDRLMIAISDMRYGNAVYPVDLAVYSLDGLEGIRMEGSITSDVSKQSANDALQGLQLAALDPSITQQAAAAGIDAVKSLVNKKIKLIKVTAKAGYPVLLMDKANRDR